MFYSWNTIILLKYAFIGFILESFGILGLFGDFFGTIVQFLRSIPYIGDVLSHPLIAPTIDRLAGIVIPYRLKEKMSQQFLFCLAYCLFDEGFSLYNIVFTLFVYF